jgi:peptidoglycan DL-endopeptidase CwlO
VRRVALLLLLTGLVACSPSAVSTAPAPAPGTPDTPPAPPADATLTADPASPPGEALAPGALPSASGSKSFAIEAGVVTTARQELGKPYVRGGTGAGESGFDCSGLIQYAYAQYGIALPRTSVEQAKQGRKISRSVEALAPGDILTFSRSPGGKKVSHVGLYLGDGRFIHSSSSRGVMESTLGSSDPNGQWWFTRWVGARRIIRE